MVPQEEQKHIREGKPDPVRVPSTPKRDTVSGAERRWKDETGTTRLVLKAEPVPVRHLLQWQRAMSDHGHYSSEWRDRYTAV